MQKTISITVLFISVGCLVVSICLLINQWQVQPVLPVVPAVLTSIDSPVTSEEFNDLSDRVKNMEDHIKKLYAQIQNLKHKTRTEHEQEINHRSNN